jgi:hypothetical protein
VKVGHFRSVVASSKAALGFTSSFCFVFFALYQFRPIKTQNGTSFLRTTVFSFRTGLDDLRNCSSCTILFFLRSAVSDLDATAAVLCLKPSKAHSGLGLRVIISIISLWSLLFRRLGQSRTNTVVSVFYLLIIALHGPSHLSF